MTSVNPQSVNAATDISYDMVCHFLYREARLLDQRRFAEWNDLFSEGGMYWIPLVEDQPDPVNHLSLAYEDSMMRQVRINRLDHERAWSQKPRSRTSHMVSAIVVEEICDKTNRLVVGSAFQMAEWRSFGLRTFAGLYTHTIQVIDGHLQIAEKRVDLIDSGEAFEPIEVFI